MAGVGVATAYRTRRTSGGSACGPRGRCRRAREDPLAGNGKVFVEAQFDATAFVGTFHQAATFAPSLGEPEQIDGPPFYTSIAHVAVGVVTIIFPFNWPLAILAATLPYALMAGNTVVAKPPPTTPLSSMATLRHVALSLPPGVLNVVTGEDSVVGPVIVGDPRVKHVCFTGSVAGGKRIMSMAPANLTNVTLELGGNDPAIILDDADLDDAAFGRLASATFMTTGQICMAIKRLYVPRSSYHAVVEGLEAALASTRIGSGLDPEVTMGPLNTRRQREYVVELLDEARPANAEVREFGELTASVDEAGNFMRGALVLDPGQDLRIVTEEQFGLRCRSSHTTTRTRRAPMPMTPGRGCARPCGQPTRITPPKSLHACAPA